MDNEQIIDEILKEWPFDPMNINVRMLESSQRRVLQMRVDMGVLQLETEGRPDGIRPNNSSTYYEFLKKKSDIETTTFELDDDDCLEIDREFVQFYHRRVCWLQLKEFGNAVKDADHTSGPDGLLQEVLSRRKLDDLSRAVPAVCALPSHSGCRVILFG